MKEEIALLRPYICKQLGIKEDMLQEVRLVKHSLDARKKDKIQYSYVVDVAVSNEKKLLNGKKKGNITPSPKEKYQFHPMGVRL